MKSAKSFMKKLYKEYMVPDRFPLIFVNTFFAGYFWGEDGLAVFGFLLPIYYLYVVVGYAVNFGAFSMTMDSLGRHEGEIAKSYSKLAVLSSLVAGGGLAIILEIFFPQILEILKIPENLYYLAENYGRGLILVGFFLVCSCYVMQFLKVAGMMRWLKLTYKIMLVLNIFVSFLCVKVVGLGMESLAVGMGASALFCMVFEGLRLYRHFGNNLFSPVKEPILSFTRLLYAGSAMTLSKILSLLQIILFNGICFKLYGAPGVAVFASLLMAIRICRTASAMTMQAVTPILLIEKGDYNVKGMMLGLMEGLRRGVLLAGFLPMLILLFGASWFAAHTELAPKWREVLANAFALYSLSLVFAAVNAIFITAFTALRRMFFANLIALLRSYVLLAVFVAYNSDNLWLSFLFAEVVAFIIILGGIFFHQKFKGYKTPLLLASSDFRPSCYEVFDYKEENWNTENFKAFIEKRKGNYEKFLAELSKWRGFFEENDFKSNRHFLAVHLYDNNGKIGMTLRDNGKRAVGDNTGQVRYVLGLNSVFYEGDD